MSTDVPTLNSVAGELVESYLRSETCLTKITETVQSTVNKSIQEALGKYGEFGKQVDAAVAQALQLHGKPDLPSYNDLILKIIAAQVQHATTESIERQVADRVKELLLPAPASIKLSELLQQYVDYLKEEDAGDCVCDGERKSITYHLKHDSTAGFKKICLDPERGKKADDCEIRIGLYAEKIYHLTFRREDTERRMFVGPLYGFHRSLFQMKAANTAIELDEEQAEAVELYYGPDHD